MAERSDPPQDPSTQDERPEVYSISQDQDGSFRLTRRSFLTLGAAAGGTLLIRGVCPRFGARPTLAGSGQAGSAPLSRVYVHAAPSIASDIADTLQASDFVRLIDDRPDLGWVKVATEGGKEGWVERSSVDSAHAIASSSPYFDLDSALSPTPTATVPQLACSVRSSELVNEPNEPRAAEEVQACGELILNGSFELGKVDWAEYTTGSIISTVAGTYDGSWAAWFGGNNAEERLTQLFHVPPDVEDAQQLTFYLDVLTTETGSGVYDVFNMRFLNAAGNPFPDTELRIADNNSPAGWYKWTIDLTGMWGVADQDIRVQFECINDSSDNTSFYLDLVSMNVTCGPRPTFVYLPIIVKQPPPTPTPIPCGSYCGSDCGSYCSSDYCSSDCPTYCGSDCGWNCSGDCYSICLYDWSW